MPKGLSCIRVSEFGERGRELTDYITIGRGLEVGWVCIDCH